MRTVTITGIFLWFLAGLAYAQDHGDGEGQATQEEVEELIKQLGADEYAVREEVQEKLEKLGTPILPWLKEALQSEEDLETRDRIGEIIEKLQRSEAPRARHTERQDDSPRRTKDPSRGPEEPKEALEKVVKIIDQLKRVAQDKTLEPEERYSQMKDLSTKLTFALFDYHNKAWRLEIERRRRGGSRKDKEPEEKQPQKKGKAEEY